MMATATTTTPSMEIAKKTNTIQDLQQNKNLWYKMHVFVYDLRNFDKVATSHDRLESLLNASYIDALYIGAPYFTPDEAATLRATAVKGDKTLQTVIRETLEDRLLRRMKGKINDKNSTNPQNPDNLTRRSQRTQIHHQTSSPSHPKLQIKSARPLRYIKLQSHHPRPPDRPSRLPQIIHEQGQFRRLNAAHQQRHQQGLAYGGIESRPKVCLSAQKLSLDAWATKIEVSLRSRSRMKSFDYATRHI
ncbi:hypothetical protein EG327_009950 [Venturia inaequalis]|uniref:Uncharacterized protein n=1 Tax=Venturia inaequalis TaxID=5025 RepID=A0A8H3UKN2_VENIN|nr:hypothetical protein EG327_009950 [Venturia inaequalis]